jgi:23S rRNA pseudouridine1911/1915/1917 synthase
VSGARPDSPLPGSPLEVLFRDNHLLAVHKPSGLPMVPDDSGDASLLELARAFVKETYGKPGEAFLAVVHRLDRPVSGVALFARTSKAAARLSEQFRSGKARKTYWGIGGGAPAAESGVVEHWLLKDGERNLVRVVDEGTAGAKLASTSWRVLARGEGRTLFEFHPRTGRAHQLRLAAASLGCPLLGDRKYGGEPRGEELGIALHALRLEIAHPTRGEALVFESPPPREMARYGAR